MARERMSAADRRPLATRAALSVFAESGYVGTSMTQVAQRLGVSQPYLFQLFDSKHALFVECVELCYDLIDATIDELEDEAGATGGTLTLAALGAAYAHLLADESVLQFQLQAWAAACADDEIERTCRDRMTRLVERVSRLTDASEQDVDMFFARGALRIVRTAIRMPMPAELDATIDYGGAAADAATAVTFLPPERPRG
ncbi:TetR/AcrR family transcriptional regulator [Leifsonia sp. TF02-11]|uniref:TetR/AcrR family transcriptional regulator n=1 Tax=Leifsonia sp. TF02-11 TaxID=2815212 RepID=UPI001AA12318|nr:TetR/AcrR family transcriptional regulator [Leifsonia sp. TF02-11]MBO1739540.1 TetR/AcrR family transcriptional regulator [Leifsonia sp. TF02-11]